MNMDESINSIVSLSLSMNRYMNICGCISKSL